MGETTGTTRWLKAAAVLTDSGWLEDGFLGVDAAGHLTEVRSGQPSGPVEDLGGYLIPGFRNAHSHAFQYAMAGLAEHLPPGAMGDDFWSWRETMYKLALRMDPDGFEAIAAMLYAEMLRHGYTSVCEFHYLHHDDCGATYSDLAEMGRRLMAAAHHAGIGLTLLPVFYQKGGFQRPALPDQRRFISPSLDAYRALVIATQRAANEWEGVRVGVAVHSLRAVEADLAIKVLDEAEGPAHIHVAEQKREVEDCLKHLGREPVDWLLENVRLDARHHLVHATHARLATARRLAATGATVVLCPSTEGNLGDGLFPLRDYLEAGGRFSIGTDSHVGLSPLEELRWLDYGQRLTRLERNVLCTRAGIDSGDLSFRKALEGGRLAGGEGGGGTWRIGAPLDGVVIDANHPVLIGKPAERRLSALLYGGDVTCFKGTLRSGQWVVRDGRHVRIEEIRARYRQAMQQLVK